MARWYLYIVTSPIHEITNTLLAQYSDDFVQDCSIFCMKHTKYQHLALSHVQCGAVITRSTHSSPVRARYGVSFVDIASDWYFASAPAIFNAISYCFVPRYNGTRLYYNPQVESRLVRRHSSPDTLGAVIRELSEGRRDLPHPSKLRWELRIDTFWTFLSWWVYSRETRSTPCLL